MGRRFSVMLLAKMRVSLGIEKPVSVTGSKIPDARIIFVVSIVLARQKYMQRVMEIVVPNNVESQAILCNRADDLWIVSVAFRDEENVTADLCRPSVDGSAKLFQKRLRGGIYNRMDGVESKRVDMKIRYPFQSVLNEISTDLIAARAIEINRASPGGLVEIRKIGTEVRQVVSLWTEVVVDHVEHHGNTFLVARVDEGF